MADPLDNLEAPENLTWERFQERALHDPIIAVYATHARLGNISREAAAIGAAITCSRQSDQFREELIRRRQNEPSGFGQVRAFLQGIIDFPGSIDPARTAARQALELLDELTRRREAAVHG